MLSRQVGLDFLLLTEKDPTFQGFFFTTSLRMLGNLNPFQAGLLKTEYLFLLI